MPIKSPPAERPRLGELKLFHTGQVRDLFELPLFPDLLLAVVSNRLKRREAPAGCQAILQGETVNALSTYWKDALGRYGFASDLVAFGPGIDEYLPKRLRSLVDLHRRATVVRRLVPLEQTEKNNHRKIEGDVLLILELRAFTRHVKFAGAELRFGRWTNGQTYLMGDVGTPDSVRYLDLEAQLATLPPLPWTGLSVAQQRQHIQAITAAYLHLFDRLTSQTLSAFQRQAMRIETD